ncbi:MAG TPA: stage II sporulation protein M, partial [Steroidobacteraceae bacterium]
MSGSGSSVTSRHAALRAALMGRAARWRDADARAGRLARRRATNADDALAALEDYRLLARDLSAARTLVPQSRSREFLESAYARAHSSVSRPATHWGYALWSLFRDQIPAVVSQLRPHILWVSLLFVLAALVGHWLVASHPDLAALFLSPEMISSVERGELWTDDILNVVPSSVLSVQILTNNIGVSLFAFCAGFLFGLGTFYMIALNGLMLGAVFAFTAQHGLEGRLFEFV